MIKITNSVIKITWWAHFKNIFPRPLFIIIFRPEMLKFHPYSILTGDTKVEFVIYCVLRAYCPDVYTVLSNQKKPTTINCCRRTTGLGTSWITFGKFCSMFSSLHIFCILKYLYIEGVFHSYFGGFQNQIPCGLELGFGER